MAIIISHYKLSLLLLLLFNTISSRVRQRVQESTFYPIPCINSPVYLQYLEFVETRFAGSLKELLFTLEEKLDSELLNVLQRYLEDYEESTKYSDRSGHFVSDNPILTLGMLNRFNKITEIFDSNVLFRRIFESIIDGDALPSSTEIVYIADAFLFLQYFYDLDANQIADGSLTDVTPTNAQISFGTCLEFAKFARSRNYFTLALQWYGVALRKIRSAAQLEDLSYEDAMMEENVLMLIRDTIEMHNHYLKNRFYIAHRGFHAFTAPIHFTGGSVNFADHLTQRQAVLEEFTGKIIFNQSDPMYHLALEANKLAVCNGEELLSEKLAAKLTCYLDTSRHPYFRINPLKSEILHETPQIIRLYDIIGDRAAATLKTISYSKLDMESSTSQTGTLKIAAYAQIEDGQIPEIKISKLIEFITGLTVEQSDPLEVAAYAFGGHVSPHYDSVSADDPTDEVVGTRVNTFLVYLNDVEKGGRTAFPFLGVSIQPVKNSAVYWYNNLKNGMNDQRMLHLACPVIKGHKWIATKWTSFHKNVFRYPCGLTQDE